jgi:uncharacterized membrane protein
MPSSTASRTHDDQYRTVAAGLSGCQPAVVWCLLELVALYFVIGAVAFYTERATMGQVAEQNWEFYAITASLFIVLSFPGFVYKYFWQRS